jgi:hypothetical protein
MMQYAVLTELTECEVGKGGYSRLASRGPMWGYQVDTAWLGVDVSMTSRRRLSGGRWELDYN